ncbi:hypothetical protein A2631_04040 [Candidatus Daviesbacteria bacterium RIFCSPHIGHO2_01_FULL_44_29]|uniref:Uncharacterized protein n=1 Tax=Candidatus Daviesbacteria bacterium RIFCSPHIGHO2_02_FULL_43_12 TaxID=1797776 RepID=A0A1F5KGF5_9BACT|nr:MAG: hypothetical protein A2631_04040 [Candidatus Daviesbacteria bacterium RIFCSPHIGHO2_01_FULL_44_29]OGE39900.1 MAG: hypothetical protein A3D25_03770 [Candidatus Daviesbacteria bacterium RIFCSPHIGHO2_02_FULL_43_12]OGE40697.1 MAG: hypothetical protein A3E86_04320 [Candidatus Daviesbacteria bacterium RIFCSPHIGHO2_12_FULL_47_45]OGE70419.1 MAG: hypothetical protein A3B55_01800 [Candidatus Daviesbacteria bacterium RIFCSPLOWO2_01_FULL_43_15]
MTAIINERQGARPSTPQQRAATVFLRDRFNAFDERWLVGHKGDHASNLHDLGIIGQRVHVAHVHSTLGVDADRTYKPPEETSDSYEGLLTGANPGLSGEVSRVRAAQMRVVVLMPFPNSDFEGMIARAKAGRYFVSTAPIESFETFEPIENKISFARILQAALQGTPHTRNLIPWTIHQPHWGLDDVRRNMGVDPGSAIFFQKAISGGGDGTARVNDRSNFNELLSNPSWMQAARRGKLKASMAVEGAYPANGTGCIVPTPDGGCKVLVDPLSHKPVGLESVGAKPGSGAGNDWGTPFPRAVTDQYIAMVSRLGKYFYTTFGYTGIFGPDGLVGADSTYRMTESNSRWQGTTPYQTQNALMNGRLPIELIHYMVKLSVNDSHLLGQVNDIVGDADSYNQRAFTERGGFYIKVGGPKTKKEVREDLNGPWRWDGDRLHRLKRDGYLTPMRIYTRDYAGAQDLTKDDKTVWIKAPKVGEVVGGGLVAVGYITGSDINVFDANKPEVTSDGHKLYTQMNQLMYSQRSSWK